MATLTSSLLWPSVVVAYLPLTGGDKVKVSVDNLFPFSWVKFCNDSHQQPVWRPQALSGCVAAVSAHWTFCSQISLSPVWTELYPVGMRFTFRAQDKCPTEGTTHTLHPSSQPLSGM